MKKISLLLLLAIINTALAQQVSNNLFGINAYLHPTPCNDYGSLGAHWGSVKNSGAKTLRIGGISYDKCLNTASKFARFNIPALIDSGFRVVVQLSYYQSSAQVWTDPDSAAQQLLDSVVAPLYLQGVKDFSISNEANQNQAYAVTNKYWHYQNTATGIYDFIKAISIKIRNVAGNKVSLWGPELSYYDERLIDSLTSGPLNILPYINVFTFHSYMLGSQKYIDTGSKVEATRANIINVLRGGDTARFANGKPVTPLEVRLHRLDSIIKAYNNLNGTHITSAITEANLSYENDVNGTNPTPGTNDSLTGNGTNGILGAQYIAELMAVGMSYNVPIVFWSAIEGSLDSNYATDIGYISSRTGAFKPTYYHFQMIAKNFKGRFKWGAATAQNPHLVKAFATKNPDTIAVMILNQDTSGSASRPINLRLNGNAIKGGSNVVKINIDFGLNKYYQDTIHGAETLLILFDGAGNFLRKETCNLSTSNTVAALTNMRVNNYSQSSGVLHIDQSTRDKQEKSLELLIYPNPSDKEFRIHLSGHNTKDKGSISVFDQQGRLLKVQRDVQSGQTISMGREYPPGIYLIEVRQGAERAFKKVLKISKP